MHVVLELSGMYKLMSVLITSALISNHLREMPTMSREATFTKLVYFLSDKGSTLKEKNLHPLGANYFLSARTPF